MPYLVRLAIRQHRRRLQKPPNIGKPTVAERLNTKRFARRKASEFARKIKRGYRLKLDKDVLQSRFASSPLLDTLLPDRKGLWLLGPRRVGGTRELKVTDFSIIDHPAETMASLVRIAELECTAPDALIHFDDAYCTDIAPYLILAEMRPDLAPVFRGGRMSMPIQKVIAAVNLDRALEMRLGVQNTNDVWAFPLKQRRVGVGRRVVQTSEPQRKEEVADEFCDALDQWLDQGDMPFELTINGRAAFATIITELLDNAERHSQPAAATQLSGNWTCAAFMARRKEDGRWVYRCYMGFLSVGATIAESLATGPASMLADVSRYVNKHSFKGLSAEALMTVYALQDGITRIHEAAGVKGGIGFQELLKFVSVLSDQGGVASDAKLTLISGNTCIRLKKPYVEGVRAEATKPRLIWFNPTNDSGLPPDPDHVFDLEHRFAGTVVGISFILDHEYLKATFDDADQPGIPDQ